MSKPSCEKCADYQECDSTDCAVDIWECFINKNDGKLDHSLCSYSIGISGSLTSGQGKLDDNGYWEHPCQECKDKMKQGLDSAPSFTVEIEPNDNEEMIVIRRTDSSHSLLSFSLDEGVDIADQILSLVQNQNPDNKTIGGDIMPKINGKSFHCSCGCNVFRKTLSNKYKCNCCTLLYVGE